MTAGRNICGHFADNLAVPYKVKQQLPIHLAMMLPRPENALAVIDGMADMTYSQSASSLPCLCWFAHLDRAADEESHSRVLSGFCTPTG